MAWISWKLLTIFTIYFTFYYYLITYYAWLAYYATSDNYFQNQEQIISYDIVWLQVD